MQSFEPGEEWFWSYDTDALYESGPALTPPVAHPEDQSAPGPADRVPQDWTRQLHR